MDDYEDEIPQEVEVKYRKSKNGLVGTITLVATDRPLTSRDLVLCLSRVIEELAGAQKRDFTYDS